MAHPRLAAGEDLSAWKSGAAAVSAILIALLFLVAGIYKVTDPFGSSARLAQAQVPGWLSLPGAIALGTIEVFAGVLILIPRFRRWGAWISVALLVFFMIWVGFYYDVLRGEECRCFPWLKRAVGPGFFAGDLLMLALAALAGWWSRRPEGVRAAAMILCATIVFSGASYGVALTQNSGVQAPQSVLVDGKKTALDLDRVFLYFFDPECLHCDEAARRMATHKWKDVKIIGIATRQQQFALEFLQSTKLNGVITTDLEILKKTFPFGDPPYGVALENGRQKASLPIFDKTEPEQTLRKLGFIE